MARLVTPALVLRTVDYGEADRIVTLFCRAGGKRAAIARGARKSTRRFGAGLSLFGVGEATLSERPRADLDVLDGFHGARGYPALMLDVAKVAHGGYACELVRELLPERHSEPALFDLLVAFFDVLSAHPPRAETLRVFEVATLGLLGLLPALDELELAAETRAGLDAAMATPILRAPELTLSPTVNVACREVLGRLIQDYLGRPLKSLEFIAKLNHA